MAPSDKTSVNWRLVMVFGCFYGLQWVNTDIYFSAIRTLIQCGKTGAETEYCAEHAGACVPYPPSDAAHWSGSSHCYDKNYVLLEQAKFGAKMTSLSQVIMFVMIPVIGTFADNFGRKKVLVVSFLGVVMNGTGMTLAFSGPLSQGFFWMLLGSASGAVLAAGFDGSAFAMAADKSRNAIEDRAPAIAALLRAQAMAMALAFVLGFFILLQNLTDYSWVFVTFTLFALFCTFCTCCCLQESLAPADNHEQPVRRVSQNFQNGFQRLFADKFLMGLFFVVFLLNVAGNGALSIISGFLLGHFQYSQAVAGLAGIFLQPFVFLGTIMSTHIMKWAEPVRTYATGLILNVLAFALQGVCMCFDNLIVSQFVWWFGFLLWGVSMGTMNTALWTIVTMRVREEHRSKIQGVVQQSCMAGNALGNLIWGNMLFDPAAEGLAAGKCFSCSSAVCFGALLWYLILWTGTGAKDAADPSSNEWKLLQ